ncbi:hypothetical protein [Bacteroides sp.]
MSKKKRGEDYMKEEDEIWKKVGTGNAFKVPEGYFENLTSEVMDKLPERERPAFEVKKTTKWDKLKPLFYMAAMFIGAALIIRVASVNHKPDSTEIASVEAVEVDSDFDEYINAVLERSMMDDYSLYVYLTDPSVE